MYKELFEAYIYYIKDVFQRTRKSPYDFPEIKIIIDALHFLNKDDYVLAISTILNKLGYVTYYRDNQMQPVCYAHLLKKIVSVVTRFPDIGEEQMNTLAETVYTHIATNHEEMYAKQTLVYPAILAYMARSHPDVIKTWFHPSLLADVIHVSWVAQLYDAELPIDEIVLMKGKNKIVYYDKEEVLAISFRLQELLPVINLLAHTVTTPGFIVSTRRNSMGWITYNPKTKSDKRANILANYLGCELINTHIAGDQTGVDTECVFGSNYSYHVHKTNKRLNIYPFFREVINMLKSESEEFYPKEHARLDLPQVKFDSKMFTDPKHWRVSIGSVDEVNRILTIILDGLVFNQAQNGRFVYSCKEKALWVIHLFVCAGSSPENIKGSRNITVRQLALQMLRTDAIIIYL